MASVTTHPASVERISVRCVVVAVVLTLLGLPACSTGSDTDAPAESLNTTTSVVVEQSEMPSMNHTMSETDDDYAARRQRIADDAANAEAALSADPALADAEAEHGVDLVPPVPAQDSEQGMLTGVTDETLEANQAYMAAIDRADGASGYQPGLPTADPSR